MRPETKTPRTGQGHGAPKGHSTVAADDTTTAALALAEQGYPVFPARPTKAPYTAHGLHDATTDPEQIRTWWRQWPDALVAVPTGEASGLLVVDIDPDGAEWYADHADRLACGRVHRTRRGHHLLYRMPDAGVRNSAGRIAPGVDVRGEGGYIIWWPAHGHAATGDLDDIGEVPGWLLGLLTAPRESAVEPAGDAIPEGRRNDYLSREAFRLRRQGASVEQIRDVLAAINVARCTPPLEDREIDAIAGGKARVEPEETETWPGPIDLHALSASEPSPPAMIIDDWLPAGYASLLAGHGGVGKSGIALHLACCIALGRPWWGAATAQRRVLYLSCEDRESVLHWRLSRICQHMGITLSDLAGELDVLDLVGRESILWEQARDGRTLTAAYHYLRERMAGIDVLVVDGISDTFGGGENVRSDVKRYVNALVGLIPQDTGAVLLIGHVAKPTASGIGTSEGYSGSTGWHNSVRARWYLYPESVQGDDGAERTGALTLELQKSNLGRTDQSMTFRWDASAHMFTGERVGKSEFDRRQQETEERDGILAALRAVAAAGDYCPAATTGRRTAHHVLSARPELPESLSGPAGKRRFWRHIEALRSMQRVVEGSIRRADRKITVTLEAAEPTDTGTCANAANARRENSSTLDAGPSAANAANAAGGYGGARTHTEPSEWPTSYADIRG